MFNKPIIMKKLFLTLSLVATLVFTGCDNDNSVNPQPMGKATITGFFYADFNYTNDTDGITWDAVANTKLNVKIEGAGNTNYKEITTDANGAYTFETEIGSKSLTITITPVDFRHDVKESSTKTENLIFVGEGFDDISETVSMGDALIRDSYYPL
jgi:hypothetical protein